LDVLVGLKGTASKYIKSGMAQRCLLLVLKPYRVVDKHDRDSMIYSDGAAASVMKLLMMNKLDCYPMKVVLMRWMKLIFVFWKII
jgi:3-oxoacyl-[acyl-carrier-protein] synthase III